MPFVNVYLFVKTDRKNILKSAITERGGVNIFWHVFWKGCCQKF